MISIYLKNIILNLISERCDSNYYAGRPKSLSNEYVLSFCFKVLRSGMQWSELTVVNGSSKTVYNRFRIWTKLDIFKDAYEIILKKYISVFNFNDTFKYFATDTTFIKSIGGHDCIGKNPTDRGRNATKISILTDNFGVPWSISFFKANQNDCTVIPDTINALAHPIKQGLPIYADKGYDSKHCRQQLYDIGLNPIIAKRNTVSPKSYEESRFIVENSFSWIKQYRRIRNRYEIKIKYFESMVFLAVSNFIGKRIQKII